MQSQEVHGGFTDPFIVISKHLRGESFGQDMSVEAPQPWVLRLKEYEFYQHYDEMAEYLWRMFFVFAANSLCGREAENARSCCAFRVSRGGSASSSTAAYRLQTNSHGTSNQRNPSSIPAIFGEFSAVPRPDFLADRTGHGFATTARKAIFRVAMDLQAIQAGKHSPKVDAADIEVVRPAESRSSSFRFGWRSLLPTKGHGSRRTDWRAC